MARHHEFNLSSWRAAAFGELLRRGVDDGLAQEWLGGLMWNPALTGSVLTRLLTVENLPGHASSWLTTCSLDRQKTAVLVAAPRIEHRLSLIENGNADVDALAELALDPEPRVRFVYAAIAGDFGRRIPDGVLETLAGDSDVRVRRMAAQWEMPSPSRASSSPWPPRTGDSSADSPVVVPGRVPASISS